MSTLCPPYNDPPPDKAEVRIQGVGPLGPPWDSIYRHPGCTALNKSSWVLTRTGTCSWTDALDLRELPPCRYTRVPNTADPCIRGLLIPNVWLTFSLRLEIQVMIDLTDLVFRTRLAYVLYFHYDYLPSSSSFGPIVNCQSSHMFWWKWAEDWDYSNWNSLVGRDQNIIPDSDDQRPVECRVAPQCYPRYRKPFMPCRYPQYVDVRILV